jgi:hypothetical protein
VLLCLLAYYVEWHMRGRLAPLLFYDDGKMAAASLTAAASADDDALTVTV